MTKFDIAFDYVIENEGTKFVNDPTDRGGATKFGISEKFINGLKYDDLLIFEVANSKPTEFVSIKKGDYLNIEHGSLYSYILQLTSYILQLTIEMAKWIYQKYFWLPIYDQIENQDICNYIFDMTVQHGKKKAAELTQRAVNAFTLGTDNLNIDGKFGTLTVAAVNKWGRVNLMPLFIAVRESLFRCIVAHDKSQKKFLDGWIARCYREKSYPGWMDKKSSEL